MSKKSESKTRQRQKTLKKGRMWSKREREDKTEIEKDKEER